MKGKDGASMDSLVILRNEQAVTTSLNVADYFHKRHDHLLRDIEALKKDIPTFGEMFFESNREDSYGRLQRMFFMNRDGFSLLAMGFTGSEAMKWKVNYIKAFNAMEEELNSPEQIMARALRVADETIKKLTVDVERMKPKEEFFDAVTDSKDAIPMANVAKVLGFKGIGRNNLFKILRAEKILQPNSIPYQEYIDRGYFRVVEQRYDKPYGEVGINIKTLVFQKGIDFIRKLLINKGYV